MVVRGVGDANGIEAWRRIHQEVSPSISATALTDVMREICPGKVKHHRELIAKIG